MKAFMQAVSAMCLVGLVNAQGASTLDEIVADIYSEIDGLDGRVTALEGAGLSAAIAALQTSVNTLQTAANTNASNIAAAVDALNAGLDRVTALENAPAGGLLYDGFYVNGSTMTLMDGAGSSTVDMLVPIRDICVEAGQIIEVIATARNADNDDPSAQFTLAIFDETNEKYIAKAMTDGSQKNKDLTLIAKATATEDSDSIAICLNNEDGFLESNFLMNTIQISYKIYVADRNPLLNVAPTCSI